MPIYEYHCKKCEIKFETLFSQTDIKLYTELRIPNPADGWRCPKCRSFCQRIPSVFGFNQIKKLSGIDDTEDLTLGKIAIEGKVPSEFKPTITEVKAKEKRREMEKEYLKRVKKYDLDKPTKAEMMENNSVKVEVISK